MNIKDLLTECKVCNGKYSVKVFVQETEDNTLLYIASKQG